jgi:DNA-binding IscR family transcriptional regulator
MTVEAIANQFCISKPYISKQLDNLKRANLVLEKGRF